MIFQTTGELNRAAIDEEWGEKGVDFFKPFLTGKEPSNGLPTPRQLAQQTSRWATPNPKVRAGLSLCARPCARHSRALVPRCPSRPRVPLPLPLSLCSSIARPISCLSCAACSCIFFCPYVNMYICDGVFCLQVRSASVCASMQSLCLSNCISPPAAVPTRFKTFLLVLLVPMPVFFPLPSLFWRIQMVAVLTPSQVIRRAIARP